MISEEMIIDYIKMKSYNSRDYLPGIRIITDEKTDTIVNTIKRDMNIHNNINRFLVHENIIEISLDNNSTPSLFFFMNTENLDEVKEKLKEFCKDKQLVYQEF